MIKKLIILAISLISVISAMDQKFISMSLVDQKNNEKINTANLEAIQNQSLDCNLINELLDILKKQMTDCLNNLPELFALGDLKDRLNSWNEEIRREQVFQNNNGRNFFESFDKEKLALSIVIGTKQVIREWKDAQIKFDDKIKSKIEALFDFFIKYIDENWNYVTLLES